MSGKPANTSLLRRSGGALASLRSVLVRCTIEVSRVLSLAVSLLRHLGLGWKWAAGLVQLVAFAVLLLPGFLQVVALYFRSPHIRRGVVYGRKPRNRLDVYLPPVEDGGVRKPAPVVVYVTGGAWIIGYKAWGALLAQRLSQAGNVVCCLDYRNFPQGTILDMVEDISTAFSWVFDNVSQFSGDPADTYVVAQSAGAQLASLAMFLQAGPHIDSHPAFSHIAPWCLDNVSGFVGISGTYDIPALAVHLDRRGLHRSLFEQIMSLREATCLERVSPLHLVAAAEVPLRTILPPFHLIHGEDDRSVPLSIASDFAGVLQEHGVQASLVVCPRKSHTQLMIEDSLKGGRDQTVELVLDAIGRTPTEEPYAALAPSVLISLASRICPF